MKNKAWILFLVFDCFIILALAFLFLHSQALHSDITKIDKTIFYEYTVLEDSYYVVDQTKVEKERVRLLEEGQLEEAQKLTTLLPLVNLQIEKTSENRVNFFCPEVPLTFRRCSASLVETP